MPELDPARPSPRADRVVLDHRRLAAAVAAVGTALGESVVPDGWRPPVQGAVGHVSGAVTASGHPCVLKWYAADTAARAGTERVGLRLAGPTLGPLVPRVHAAARLADGSTVLLLDRLRGERWSDLRPGLDPEDRRAVVTDVGRVRRRLHGVTSPVAGPLVGDDDASATADPVEHARRVSRVVLEEHLRWGGDPQLGGAVEDFLLRAVAATEARPTGQAEDRFVMCHHDLNGGNVLLRQQPPVVGAVLDLERAAWGDPVHDLSLTVLHLLHHEAHDVPVLLAGYGVDATQLARLPAWVGLRAMAARAWVVQDRPEGWMRSARRLETLTTAIVDGDVDVVTAGAVPPGRS